MNILQSAFHKVVDWISAKDQDSNAVNQRAANRGSFTPVNGRDIEALRGKKSPVGETVDSEPSSTESYIREEKGFAKNVPQPTNTVDNMVQFPGTALPQAPSYEPVTFVECIVMLKSRKECKSVIEYMKDNASVFVNMEYIAENGERQRCVDVLSGAAYTLGCKMNKISPRGMYLISSPQVNVVLDGSMQTMDMQVEGNQFFSQISESFRRVKPSQMYAQTQYNSGFANQYQNFTQSSMSAEDNYHDRESANVQSAYPRMRSGTPTERFQSMNIQRPSVMNSYTEQWQQVE